MATPFAPLKIQVTYLNSSTPKTTPLMQKVSGYLYRTEICAILAYFCPNLVAMATPFAPLKIQIAYLNLLTPKTLPYTQKVNRYLVRNWNLCNFGLFLPKFGCHGSSLCSLENSDSIFEFADPENHTLYAKSVLISCTELKSVQFWLIFAQIWLPWQRRMLPWKFK